MGFGTRLVGVLPTYDQIGILAPALLILLRLPQAVGDGGKWGGAILLVCESAPARRRGLFGSFERIPFLARALLVGAGLVIGGTTAPLPRLKPDPRGAPTSVAGVPGSTVPLQ
jgi:MFS family permease